MRVALPYLSRFKREGFETGAGLHPESAMSRLMRLGQVLGTSSHTSGLQRRFLHSYTRSPVFMGRFGSLREDDSHYAPATRSHATHSTRLHFGMPADRPRGIATNSVSLSVAAMADVATPMLFTPVTSGIAGCVLGMATLMKLVGNGRVLGISGTFGGVIQFSPDMWRYMFMVGMAAGTLAAVQTFGTAAFDVFPITYTIGRAALGGLLVGVGSTLGNGCTSGHGICGNSRLSPRSMAQTATAMVAGSAVAILTDTMGAMGVAPDATAPLYLPGSFSEIAPLVGLAGVTATALAGLAFMAKTRKPGQRLSPIGEGSVELLSGAIFSMGLAASGMTKASKVAGFLSFLHPAWDFSLAFVMGGALLISMPITLLLLNKKVSPAFRDLMEVPANRTIDAKLLLGGAIFGAGWGLSGMCPGPGFVNLVANPGAITGAYIGAMALGMIGTRKLESTSLFKLQTASRST